MRGQQGENSTTGKRINNGPSCLANLKKGGREAASTIPKKTITICWLIFRSGFGKGNLNTRVRGTLKKLDHAGE